MIMMTRLHNNTSCSLLELSGEWKNFFGASKPSILHQQWESATNSIPVEHGSICVIDIQMIMINKVWYLCWLSNFKM